MVVMAVLSVLFNTCRVSVRPLIHSNEFCTVSCFSIILAGCLLGPLSLHVGNRFFFFITCRVFVRCLIISSAIT